MMRELGNQPYSKTLKTQNNNNNNNNNNNKEGESKPAEHRSPQLVLVAEWQIRRKPLALRYRNNGIGRCLSHCHKPPPPTEHRHHAPPSSAGVQLGILLRAQESQARQSINPATRTRRANQVKPTTWPDYMRHTRPDGQV